MFSYLKTSMFFIANWTRCNHVQVWRILSWTMGRWFEAWFWYSWEQRW